MRPHYVTTHVKERGRRRLLKLDPHLLLLLLISLVTILVPPTNSISVSDIRGWDHIAIFNNFRLQQRQQQQESVTSSNSDVRGQEVALSVNNIQQCLKMCWLFTSCKVVTYSMTSDSTSASCRLFQGDPSHSVALVADSNAVVVNMTIAVVDKERLHGCDLRPCHQNHLCMTRKRPDAFSCLPLASTICGDPPSPLDNAILSADGMGAAYYQCKSGFAPTPERGVRSECDKATGQWSSVTLSCRFVDCGPPPTLDGATMRHTNTSYGAVSKYLCSSGHFSPSEGGHMKITCQANGRWSEMPRPCTLVDCGYPQPVENGRLQLPVLLDANGNPSSSNADDTRTLYGGVVTHSCLQGFTSPTPTSQSYCQINGNWSTPTSFQCNPLDCGQPPMIENTNQTYTSTTYLSNTTYSCQAGFQSPNQTPGEDSSTLSSSQCQQDGAWSGVNIICLPVDCGTPPDLPGVKVTANGTIPGAHAYLSCTNSSHLLVGSDQLTCNRTGQWTHSNASCITPPCAPPTPLANASLTVKMADNGGGDTYVAVYHCLPGFMFDADQLSMTLTCIDSFWENSADSSCNPIDCGPPPEVPNTDVIAPSHTYLSTATYSCLTGFRNTTGFNQITCLENGSWSQEEFRCSKMTCGLPLTVEYSTNKISLEYNYGDEIVYTCENGFSLKTSTNDTIACTDKGWETTLIQCVPTPCGPPPIVLNASHVIDGDQVVYTCDEGMVVKEGQASSKSCGRAGQWSEDAVLCVLDQCLQPPEVDNATPTFNSTSRGSTVIYECNQGFSLAGGTSNQRVCLDDLEWSIEQATCEIMVECGPPPSIHNTNLTYTSNKTGSTAYYRCIPGFVLQKDANSTNPTTTESILEDPNLTPTTTESIFEDTNSTPTTTASPFGIVNGPIINFEPEISIGRSGRRRLLQVETDLIWTAYCNSSGLWSSDMAIPKGCILVDCGDPPQVENAIISSQTGNNTLGSVAVYSCVHGFQLKSAVLNSKLCGANVIWEGGVDCVARACEEHPSIPNAKIVEQNLTVNGHTVFECGKGYYVSPSTTNSSIKVTCLDNLIWSNTSDQCLPVNCNSLPDSSNSTVRYHETVFNMTCEEEFIWTMVAPGNETETMTKCMLRGKWRYIEIHCLQNNLTCPYPEYPEDLHGGGKVTVEGLKHGDSVSYACQIGYEHLWFDRKTCRQNGTWTNPKIKCQIVDCGPPRQIENAVADYTNTTTFGTNVKYRCNNGYVARSKSNGLRKTTLECLRDGWSNRTIECLSKRSNTKCPGGHAFTLHAYITVSSYKHGGTTSVLCDEGFHIKDHELLPAANKTFIMDALVCVNGTWVGDKPECEDDDCGSPPEIINAIASFTNTIYKKIVTYICHEGYILPGPSSKQCMAGGHWSNETVECIPRDTVYCPPPTGRSSMKIGYRSHLVGSKATYTCIHGYLPKTKQVECLTQGRWSGLEDFQCIPVDCLHPPEIPNTVLHVHLTTFGHHAVYTCSLNSRKEGDEGDDGLDLKPSRSQCQADRTWTDVKSPCVHCSKPRFNSTTMIPTQNQEIYDMGEIATYNCSEGYSVFPNNTVINITCGQDLEWSEFKSYCVPEMCLNISLRVPNAKMISGHIDDSSGPDLVLLVDFVCEEGYYHVGSTHANRGVAVCHLGKALLEVRDEGKLCVPVDCGTPREIPNASVLYNQTTYPSIVTYRCNTSSIPSGSVFESVCQKDGHWSSVDLICVQCATENELSNGYLDLNYRDPTIPILAAPMPYQKPLALVVCHDDFLLFDELGSVNPVVSCILNGRNATKWAWLEDLTCFRRVWRNPEAREEIHVTNSYQYYNICLEMSFGATDTVSLSLPATNHEGKPGIAFLAVIFKGLNRVDVGQLGFDGTLSALQYNVAIADQEVNQMCIGVDSHSKTYTVWIDEVLVGHMTDIQIAVSNIDAFTVDDQRGHGFQLYNLTITV